MRVIADVRQLSAHAAEDGDAAEEVAALDFALQRIVARLSANGSPAGTVAGELSMREVEVLKHVGEGRSNKQIARMLRISEVTVRNHLSHMFRKLDAANRTDAVIIAMKTGQLGL